MLKNFKSGFSIIELVFVIIIIGVLAAVALPKLNNNAVQAKIAVINSFTNTVNKEVFPVMWGISIKDEHNGDITTFKIKDYMSQIPKIVGDVNLSKCDDSKNYKIIKTIEIDNTKTVYLECKNGNSNHSPKLKIEVK